MKFQSLKRLILEEEGDDRILECLREGFLQIEDLNFSDSIHQAAFFKYFLSLKNEPPIPQDFHKKIDLYIFIEILEKHSPKKFSRQLIDFVSKVIQERVDEIPLMNYPFLNTSLIKKVKLINNPRFRQKVKEMVISLKMSGNSQLFSDWINALSQLSPELVAEIKQEIAKRSQIPRYRVSKNSRDYRKKSIKKRKIPLFKEAIMKDSVALWRRSKKDISQINENDFLEIKGKWVECKTNEIRRAILRTPFFFTHLSPQEQAKIVEQDWDSLASTMKLEIYHNIFHKIYELLPVEICLNIFRAILDIPYTNEFEIKIPLEKVEEMLRFAALKNPDEETTLKICKTLLLFKEISKVKCPKNLAFHKLSPLIRKSIESFLEEAIYEKCHLFASLYEDLQEIDDPEERKELLTFLASKIKVKFASS